MSDVTRRQFGKGAIGAAAGVAGMSYALPGLAGEAVGGTIKIGLISDVHHGLVHDATDRMKVFIDRMLKVKPDFIMQMGDFCWPRKESKEFMAEWDRFKGEKYHILGNHDMDLGFSREDCLKFWDMPAKYYSFEKGGFLFVVLDGNDKKKVGKASGYPSYMGSEQRAWFKGVLKGANKPVICFSHQAASPSGGMQNAEQMRGIVNAHNKKSDHKVVAWLNGHHHVDRHDIEDDVLYLQINSASYKWIGSKYLMKTFSDDLHRKYQHLAKMAVYQDSLYAVMTVGDGKLVVEGVRSDYIGPSDGSRGGWKPGKKPMISDGEFEI